MEEGRKGLRKLNGRGAMRTFVIVVVAIAFTISPAFADLGHTSVSGSHATILKGIYGGSYWGTTGGINYLCGSMRAWRVYDSDGSELRLDLITGDPTDVDQVWTDGASSATVTVKYTNGSSNQSFGWNEGGLGTGTYEELLTEADLGGPGAPIDVTGDFLLGYKPSGQEWWSLQSENDFDHMVTYKMENLPGRTEDAIWLIFMESDPLDTSDKAYNDFVVEIAVVAAPEPATAFLLISGIALVLRKR
jgi:hypothetical protein